MNFEWATSFVGMVIQLASPILLAAIGEMILERSGILNIGVEGVMLMGAFTGYVASLSTGNVYFGLLGGVFGGLSIALSHGFFSITLKADQIVSGICLNVFAFGVTTFALRLMTGVMAPPMAPSLDVIKIPLLSDVPLLGALFKQNLLVYLTYISIPLSWLIMYKTTWGLKTKAVGEDPRVADSVGINVVATRYIAIVVNGTLGGLAGAMLSLGFLRYFTQNMTAGRGFLVLAAVIFGKWSPMGVAISSLIFGGVDGAQITLQVMGLGIPYPFLLMLPYVVTLIALALMKYVTPPKSLALPYGRE